jgi:S-adenosylmethionine:tRNA ribosyltransferase-isomerase
LATREKIFFTKPDLYSRSISLKPKCVLLFCMLKTNDFDFNLPDNLIAQEPHPNKEETPLLVFKNNQIFDQKIKNIIDHFEAGDVIIFNQVKVIKAKLQGTLARSLAKINLNLDQEIDDGLWQALCRPAKKIKEQDKIIFNDDFYGVVIKKNDDGFLHIKFNVSGDQMMKAIEKYGSTPLPPYIKRTNEQNQNDQKNYQTIFAKEGAGVAAPTAGLHFTEKLISQLENKNIKILYLTLNIGAGTFLPVRSENISDHKMHSEKFYLSEKNCEIINQAKKNGKKIIAVGTTSLRALESSVDDQGLLTPQNRSTDIFIYPPFKFKIVDILITNFHLPKSTLYMLVSAFVGIENAHKIYQHAINNNYRFYSFGDCSLLYNSSL